MKEIMSFALSIATHCVTEAKMGLVWVMDGTCVSEWEEEVHKIYMDLVAGKEKRKDRGKGGGEL